MAKAKKGQLSVKEFTYLAIDTFRTGDYKGIHARISGFNAAFRDYFNGQDPVESTGKMATNGDLVVIPCKGGVMLYKPGEQPTREAAGGKAALKAMGL